MNYTSFRLFHMTPPSIDLKESFELMFDIPSLSFDRIHAGHIAASSFPLFQIPIELFPHILDYLSMDDLLAFSQVDRDCRRLALLSIFKDVRLCFPPNIHQMFFESIPVLTTTNQWPHSPSPTSYIASCIRRLTITADSSNGSIPNYDTVGSEYDYSSREKINSSLDCFVEAASQKIQKCYPNIHVLDWDTPMLLSASTFNSILTSPIKHLRLKGATIYDDGSFTPSTGKLFLETLSLDVSSIRTKNHHSHIFRDILLRTSATLRQLIWSGHLNEDEIDINGDIPEFPCLRSITLDPISPMSDKVIQNFLGSSTRVETLAIDPMTSSTCNFFTARGYISSLKQLCWLNHTQGDLSSYDTVLKFLQNNTQLEALHIPGPASPHFLLLLLLPTLRQHFNALHSLHLVWASSDIHEDSLVAISTISTLRHLWLSAGNQNSLRNTWEVNHQSILTCLSPLRHLETFSLSHDTYKVNAHPLAPRSYDYYASRAIPVDLDVSKYLSAPDFDLYQGKNVDFSLGCTQQIEMRRRAWECWHAERMLAITNQYAVRFPTLRWLFIGQLLFTKSVSKPFGLAHKGPRRDPYLISLQKKMSMTVWRPI